MLRRLHGLLASNSLGRRYSCLDLCPQLIRRGELPGSVQLGGRYYVKRAVLMAFLAGADVVPPTEDRPVAIVGRPSARP